jgi:hypothetical protein
MTECALCNAAPGVRAELAIEDAKTIEIALCDPCREAIVAESWIECTGIATPGRSKA